MSCLDCHCHPTPHQPLIMRWGIMELTTASYHLRGPPFGVVLSSLEKMAAMHNYSGILVALQQLIVFLIVSVTCFIGRLYSAAHCQFLLGVSLASNGRCFFIGRTSKTLYCVFSVVWSSTWNNIFSRTACRPTFSSGTTMLLI